MKKLMTKVRALPAVLLTLVQSAMFSSQAMAVTAPSEDLSDTIGYQIYDIVFNNIYNSGLQYVIAGCLLLWAGMQVKQNWKEAVGWGIGAMVIAALTTILTGLGAVA